MSPVREMVRRNLADCSGKQIDNITWMPRYTPDEILVNQQWGNTEIIPIVTVNGRLIGDRENPTAAAEYLGLNSGWLNEIVRAVETIEMLDYEARETLIDWAVEDAADEMRKSE